MAISAKTRKLLRERSRGVCEARLSQYGCTVDAEDPHHVKSKARGGSDRLENLLHVCRACHRAWANRVVAA